MYSTNKSQELLDKFFSSLPPNMDKRVISVSKAIMNVSIASMTAVEGLGIIKYKLFTSKQSVQLNMICEFQFYLLFLIGDEAQHLYEPKVVQKLCSSIADLVFKATIEISQTKLVLDRFLMMMQEREDYYSQSISLMSEDPFSEDSLIYRSNLLICKTGRNKLLGLASDGTPFYNPVTMLMAKSILVSALTLLNAKSALSGADPGSLKATENLLRQMLVEKQILARS